MKLEPKETRSIVAYKIIGSLYVAVGRGLYGSINEKIELAIYKHVCS